MEFSGNFRSLIDVSGNFILIKFSGIPKLVEFSRFLRHRVDVSGNFKLINFSGFPKFQFKVKVVYYQIFLLAIRGGK